MQFIMAEKGSPNDSMSKELHVHSHIRIHRYDTSANIYFVPTNTQTCTLTRQVSQAQTHKAEVKVLLTLSKSKKVIAAVIKQLVG